MKSIKLQGLIQFLEENLDIIYDCPENDNKYGRVKSPNGSEILIFLYPINSSHYSHEEKIETLEKLDINSKVVICGNNYFPDEHLFRTGILYEAELIGFIYSLGFKLLVNKELIGNKYFCFEKFSREINLKKHPYSPLIKLNRIGQNGKPICIYKIRTMHPYSEYLQEYMVETYNYGPTGKINNDFRITKFGQYLRKYYLDELPQIINLLKGDIALVGCRPVSNKFLENYPIDLYNQRIKNKPGIITPAIADRAKTVEEVVRSESVYLVKRLANPVKTDLYVFYKAIRNFLTGSCRSS